MVPDRPTRRQVLTWGGGALGGLGVTACAGRGASRPARTTTTTTIGAAAAPASTVPLDQRILVVIEMVGGNDGLSTLVPIGDGRYHDARPTTAIAESDLIDLGDGFGLNAGLAALHTRGLAVVNGIGARQATLSHFDMMAKWAAGAPPRGASEGTGYLGRICDRLGGDDGQLVGMSISPYPSGAVASSKRTTVTMATGDGETPMVGSNESSTRLLRASLARMSGGDGKGPLVEGRAGLDQMLDVGTMLAGLPAVAGIQLDGGPGDTFKRQLQFAARLIAGAAGVRVIHIPMGYADFDTHDIHLYRYPVLMKTLSTGLDQFCAVLDTLGVADQTLIATTSEFGRRVRENQGGLDHGTASCALLMGPVVAGIHEEAPSLRRLDDDGNLRPTVAFSRYLSTMASWLGVEPSDVIGEDTRPLVSVISA